MFEQDKKNIYKYALQLQGGLLEFFFVVVLIFFRFVKPNTTKFFEEWYGV